MIGVLLVSILMSVSAMAQGGKGYLEKGNLAIVPVDVLSESGRQGVLSDLGGQVDSVHAWLEGNSVIGDGGRNYRILSREQLRERGYVDDGSFSQLFEALADLSFTSNVIPTKDDWYDVRVVFSFRTTLNRECLSGSAWINIHEDSEGHLHVHDTTPYVWLPEGVAIRFNEAVTAARWHGPKGEIVDLSTWIVNDTTTDVPLIPMMFDDGYLMIAYKKPIEDFPGAYRMATRGYNLSEGGIVEGKDFFAQTTVAQSSEVYMASGFGEIRNHGQQFYPGEWWSNFLYGRFPLIELTLTMRSTGVIDIEVPIWGAEESKKPRTIRIRSVRPNTPLADGGEIVIEAGASVTLPEGIYHIMSTFDGVLGWEFSEGKG